LAAEVEGVRFAERVSVGGQDLRVRGVALLRYRVVFRAYVAALYLPAKLPGGAALSDVPKRLEIEYFWALEAGDIARLGGEILERNVSVEEFSALRERLSRIDAAYVDVEPGDRYALSYEPGRGTTLSLNGVDRVNILGADFAKAYFSIWLGDEPLDAGLKARLLGDR